MTQHQIGDEAGAIASFTQAHRLKPKLFVPALFLGVENIKSGKPKEALPYLEEAKRINRDDPNVSMYLGQAYLDLKQYKQAASAYSEVANRDSKNGDAWYQRVYASQGKDQQAIEELKLGLPSDYDGSVHFQLGRLYQKAGQQKLAQAAFDETKRLQNKH